MFLKNIIQGLQKPYSVPLGFYSRCFVNKLWKVPISLNDTSVDNIFKVHVKSLKKI